MPPDNYFDLTSIFMDGVEVKAKRCRKCENIKPLTDYYKHKSCLGGVASKCKTCCGIKGNYTQAVIKQIIVNGEEVPAKNCVKCNRLIALSEFTEIKGKKKGTGNGKNRALQNIFTIM